MQQPSPEHKLAAEVLQETAAFLRRRSLKAFSCNGCVLRDLSLFRKIFALQPFVSIVQFCIESSNFAEAQTPENHVEGDLSADETKTGLSGCSSCESFGSH